VMTPEANLVENSWCCKSHPAAGQLSQTHLRGILTVLEKHLAGDFIGALPTSALDLSLLWAASKKDYSR